MIDKKELKAFVFKRLPKGMNNNKQTEIYHKKLEELAEEIAEDLFKLLIEENKK